MDELKEVESEKVGEWMNTELVDICGTYIWCIHMEHTNGIFQIFEFQIIISMLYTCCPLDMLLVC
jgi:hypothetical protein